ncbi:TPA: hypothetical protein VJ286_001529 [Streptococcus pyogenes]|nr:hypothetical protein [Streptococcus pyogenes]
MKKKLMLAAALLAVGVATNVKAEEAETTESQEEIKYELEGKQQEIKDENGTKIFVENFYSGAEKITVHMPKGWAVRLYRQPNSDLEGNDKGILVEVPYLCENVVIDTETDKHTGLKKNITQARYKDGYRMNYDGWNYQIPLQKNLTEEQKEEKKLKDKDLLNSDKCPNPEEREKEPLTKDERLTFEFRGDGNFYAGSLVYVNPNRVTKKKLVDEQRTPDTSSVKDSGYINGNSEHSSTSSQEESILTKQQTWTQRAKERIKKFGRALSIIVIPKIGLKAGGKDNSILQY